MAGDRPDFLRATTIESDFEVIVLGDTSKAASYPFTPPHAIAGVYVTFFDQTANAGVRLQLSVTNITKGVTFPAMQAWAVTDLSGNETPAGIIVPAMSAPGDQLQLNVSQIGIPATWTISAWSMTQLPGALAFRTDGRPTPFGASAFNSTATGSTTLIAAPGAGLRIMLASLMVQVSSGAGAQAILEVLGTINGQSFTLGVAAAGVASTNYPQAPTQIPERGILLDPNTALTTFMGGTAASAIVAGTYDVVT